MKRKRPTPAAAGQAPPTPDAPAPAPDDAQAQALPSSPSQPAPDQPITPVKRGRGRPPGSKNKPKPTPNGIIVASAPSSSTRKKDIFSTPTKSRNGYYDDDDDDIPTPLPLLRHADRSAKRKSAQRLIERRLAGSDDDEDHLGLDEDDRLARRIWDEQASDDASENNYEPPTPSKPTTTPKPTTTTTTAPTSEALTTDPPPIKRGRGRPKGSKTKNRPPTPEPSSLPPHEAYFFQTRPSTLTKTSNHTLAQLPPHLSLLTHESYFALTRSRAHTDPHLAERQHLHALHARSFPQWQFELSQGFNICLYGWGSKRSLVMDFAQWFSSASTPSAKILIVNGYAPALLPRDILLLISRAILPPTQRLSGTQPPEMLSHLLSLLSSLSPPPRILLIIHSLDAPPLRAPQTQALLSQLALHPAVSLLATTTHPLFPLLWDGTVRQGFNFVFHDTTTFAPYEAEVDVVTGVDELMGRSGRRVGGREGVGFVLKSLGVKGKGLYRLLLGEILAQDEEDDEDDGGGEGDGDEEGEEGGGDEEGGRRDGREGREGKGAVEYRVLYRKAVEDFVVGNEVAFRGMLKEFHDHQMVVSRKDTLGTEFLAIPFRRAEMEGMLEDLME